MQEILLERNRAKMNYDKEKTPLQNLNIFFDAVKTLRYELVEIKIGKKKEVVLQSAWKNENELKEIISRFQEEFTEHLITTSMDEKIKEPYPAILKECKKLLRKVNSHYSLSLTHTMIFHRNNRGDEMFVSVESLSNKQTQSILHCYDLLTYAFRDLYECVLQEEREYAYNLYVRSKSTYVWDNDKNDLSELAMAIFASGAVKRSGMQVMMEAPFAREFASFFNVEKLNFPQDIALIASRNAKRPQGEFIDTCKENLLKVYDEKLNPKKKKN